MGGHHLSHPSCSQNLSGLRLTSYCSSLSSLCSGRVLKAEVASKPGLEDAGSWAIVTPHPCSSQGLSYMSPEKEKTRGTRPGPPNLATHWQRQPTDPL